MKVSGQVEVDVLHGQDLGPTAACSAAFDAEDRAHGGFPDNASRRLTDGAQGLGQADGGDGFSLTKRRGVYRCDQHQTSRGFGKPFLEGVPGDFG